jgi:hypothetical protein
MEIRYYPPGFDPDVRGMMVDTSTSKTAIFVEKKHRTMGDNYRRTGEEGDSTTYEYWGQRYDAENDLAIVSPLSKMFEVLWSHAYEASILSAGTPHDVESALRQTRQYNRAKLDLRTVKMANLKPLHRFIDAVEYGRVQQLAEKMVLHKLPLWSIAKLQAPASDKVICPPIIEIHDGDLLITDGLARVYYSRQKGSAEIVAYVIVGVSEPPVGSAWTWDKIEIVEHTNYSKQENFQNFNAQYWRELDNTHTALEWVIRV